MDVIWGRFRYAGLFCLGAYLITGSLPLAFGQDAAVSAEAKTAAVASNDAGLFASGPLRVSKRNPRYFEDAEGRIVYLTGSHTWANVCDFGRGDPPPVFDNERYLKFLQARNHNFIRLWAWEYPKCVIEGHEYYFATFPWPRSGPGLANDGKPKFDLKAFDESYFKRLRDRVVAAGRQDIYVSVMMFEGCLAHSTPKDVWRWKGHPFIRDNNINGIHCDPSNKQNAKSFYTLDVPKITRIQETYVRKVIDTVNDLDNVIYEISNESGGYSTAWQYHLIRIIKNYEKGKPKQHPVGMTFAWSQANSGTDADLFASEADWISPGQRPYVNDVPANDGKKVILLDSDHIAGGKSARIPWIWKAACRGINLLLMDIECDVPSILPPTDWYEPVRRNMGYARMFLGRMNLAEAVPCNDLSSTKYCLSDKKTCYLVYSPTGPTFSVDLSAAEGFFNMEWLNPKTGEILPSGQIHGESVAKLTAPFSGEAVLYLWKPRKPD